MFLFAFPDSSTVLHTGDFRADEELLRNVLLQGKHCFKLH